MSKFKKVWLIPFCHFSMAYVNWLHADYEKRCWSELGLMFIDMVAVCHIIVLGQIIKIW